MAARITDIFPFLIITLLCVGIVEGGYQALEYFALRVPSEKAAISGPVTVQKKSPIKVEQKENYDYRIILQRNLFGPPPGKEEPVETAAQDVQEEMQATSLNIVLMGTINGGKGTDRAIILDKGTRKQELYETGDAIQGAIIKEILRGKVILAYNGKDEMLDMSEAANVRQNAVSPAARFGAARVAPPVVRGPVGGTTQLNRPPLTPQGTPRRVISRPRAIRPSRSIR
jgi:Type II secretion system protein C